MMRLASVASWGLLFVVGLGCGSAADAPTSRIGGDSRYRVDFERVSGASGEWRLRLAAEEGWKIAPEAPVHLRLKAPEGFHFAQPHQRAAEALEYAEDVVVFGLALEGEAADDARPKESAHADLKFGVCRSEERTCQIVRAEFELPL